MKYIPVLLFLFPVALSAQTTHTVEAGGTTLGGPAPYYSPAELTIAVNDIVAWTNVSGTHNVNGSLTDFPDNPEGFFSGQPTANLDFSYTFTIPGIYQYHCDQQGHSDTQHGTITVLDPNSVQEDPDQQVIALFPVPTSDLLVVELGVQDIRRAEVLGVDGRSIASLPVIGRSRIEISTSGMVAGQYYLRLTDADGRVITRPFRKERM